MQVLQLDTMCTGLFEFGERISKETMLSCATIPRYKVLADSSNQRQVNCQDSGYRKRKVVCSELENTQGRVWVVQERKRVRYSVREEQ